MDCGIRRIKAFAVENQGTLARPSTEQEVLPRKYSAGIIVRNSTKCQSSRDVVLESSGSFLGWSK